MLALRFLPSISRVRSFALAGLEYSMRAIDHLGLLLIDWACMPKAPRQAVRSCLAPHAGSTSGARVNRADGAVWHGVSRSTIGTNPWAALKNVTARAQVGYL